MDRENDCKKIKHSERAGKIICINTQAKVIHLVDLFVAAGREAHKEKDRKRGFIPLLFLF